MLNLLKHRGEEHDSKNSSGFTIAELGAGLGVFAVAASLMMPMAISSATATMTADGDTNVTVDNDNGRKPVSTPPTEAVEVTVVDAAGNEVRTVPVDDPDATSTVISGLDPDKTYTFEVAKINAAGKSAKATAKLDYQKTGTEEYEVDVTENYTERKSATVSASPEQVDDTSRPKYKTVDDKSKPIYKKVQENYTVQEPRTRTVRVPYRHRVATPQYRYYDHTHTQTRYRTATRYYNHRHSWNHTHYYSWSHYHWSPYGGWYHSHRGSSNHTHYSNHRHSTTYRQAYQHSYNHRHREQWNTTYSYETRYRNETENYTVPVTKTRTKTVQDGYEKKQVFDGYAKKTQYRLCYQPRGRNGVKKSQRCEVKSSPATKKLSWTVDKQRTVQEKRSKDVFDHVKQASVKAQPGYVVFKADNLTEGDIIRSGEVASVGAGVSNISEGSDARFLRWSGKPFTFNGEKYIKVHRFAVR